MNSIQKFDVHDINPEVLWLLRASLLDGKSPLQAAVIVLSLHQRFGRQNNLPIPQLEFDKYGVSITSGYRGLNALRDAGLIKLTRRKNCTPLVDMIVATGASSPLQPDQEDVQNRDDFLSKLLDQLQQKKSTQLR